MGASPFRKRPTQDDVARRAGVSQTVVSMVLNDHSAVAISPETRQRVLTAIDELGYVPDGSARSLRTRKTSPHRQPHPGHRQPFLPRLRTRHSGCRRRPRYDLIAYNTDEVREKELRTIRSMQRARVDGVIATPFQVTPRISRPLASGVPVVVFGELTVDAPDFPIDYVYVDDDAAARELVAYLVDRDLLPLAVISGSTESLRRDWRVPAYSRCWPSAVSPHEEIVARRRPHRAWRI